MAKSTQRTILAGDEVVSDIANRDQNKVCLGDMAPVFVRTGDKVICDIASVDQGKVRLGDLAPTFAPRK
jgi:sRNA-binding carbon storage regulator CsrA